MKLNLIVRVITNNYMHKNKLVSNTTATLLKRRSNGSLGDLISDPDLDVRQLNLGSYSDGLYQMATINNSYDIESGILDDYDLILIPIEDKS